MPRLEDYEGREQSFLKHYFLEHYLQRVAFKVGHLKSEFVYVDGFSGPWKSTGENFSDTSFTRAIERLRYVREGLENVGKSLKIRCLFIEEKPKRFNQLKKEISAINDIEIEVFQGEFENLIPKIIEFIGNSFSLVFVDPIGWKGYQLDKIKPLLQLPGEILINFMFNRINQFIEKSMEDLLGNLDKLPEHRELINNGVSREDAIISIYLNSLKETGGFQYLASTPILMPHVNRLFFHLIYGTRHFEGLREFRKIEESLFGEQIQVRGIAQQNKRIKDSGQAELFEPEDLPEGSKLLQQKRNDNLNRAWRNLKSFIGNNQKVSVEKVFKELLENTFVWESDIKEWIEKMRTHGEIEILNMEPREKAIKLKHIISRKN